MTQDVWAHLVETTYLLIKTELTESLDNIQQYPERLPKLLVACEYFRLLRGEAFHSQRPPGVTFANGMTAYQMEDELAALFKEVVNHSDTSDQRVQYHLAEMAKVFTSFA